MFSTSVILLLPFVAFVNAANDWSQPCITGQCSYDLSANGTSSGTMTIWGSTGAISDITTAADWEILDCDETALNQSIRLVCQTAGSDKCAHLYGDAGAVNKIIRLPESCGASAFARVSKSWIPDDQSIPASIAPRIVRRAGEPAQVKALAIDTDFDSVDYSKTGPINFAIQGANVPEAGYSADPLNLVGPSGRSTHLSERGLFGFAKKAVASVASKATAVVKTAAQAVAAPVVHAVAPVIKAAAPVVKAAKKVVSTAAKDTKAVAKKVVSTAKTAEKVAVKDTKAVAKKVVSTAKTVGKAAVQDTKAAAKAVGSAAKAVVKDTKAAAKAVGGAAEAVGKAAVKDTKAAAKVVGTAAKDVATNDIDAKKTFDLKPLSFSKSIPLLDKSVECGPVTAKLSVDLDASANAQATISVAAQGTLVPPKLTDFGVITGLNAKIDGSITLDASVAGSLDSGKIEVFSIGIPGLDFPGILTIGPSFDVNAEFTGSFEVDLNMKVGIVFDVDNAQIAFPPGTAANPSGNAFSIGDTPLTLAATPNVEATGTVAAHLIPSLNLGIEALGGKAKATVHVDLDASASATLSLEASAEAATTLLTKKPTATPAAQKDSAAKDEPKEVASDKVETSDSKEAASDPKAASSSAKTTEDDKAASTKSATTTTTNTLKATTNKATGQKLTKTQVSDALAAAAAAKKKSKRGVSASFGGCFEVDAGVEVSVGADASFFGLFDTGVSKSLFRKDFEIFKKCFGNQARRSFWSRSKIERDSRSIQRRALGCPKKTSDAEPEEVTSGTVKSSAIKGA